MEGIKSIWAPLTNSALVVKPPYTPVHPPRMPKKHCNSYKEGIGSKAIIFGNTRIQRIDSHDL
jgi:hypothetical protein